MVEFDKLAIAQHDDQKLPGKLPGDEVIVDHMQNDVDMREITEIAMSPCTSTPRQGSSNNHGLLTPNAASAITPQKKSDQYPIILTAKPINPALTTGQTLDRPKSWIYKSSRPAPLPGRRPSPRATISESGYYNLQREGESLISSGTTEKEMATAQDHMKPLPDPYFRHRDMAAVDEVDEAHHALFAHMRTRFRPTQDSTPSVQSSTNYPMLPLPQSTLAHQQQSKFPYRSQPSPRLFRPSFPTTPHISMNSHYQIRPLSELLAVERTKNHNPRDLAGLSFHHVVQRPFANELRAHYTVGEGRGISMYKLQLPVQETSGRTVGERQTEVWYFFALSGQLAPVHNTFQQGHSTERNILALPAEDLEEHKSEECPLFNGGGEQVQARRREYSIRAGGRFRLECQMAMDHTWSSIRQDLQDGSCRLFTWIEI